ncbi:MAG: division plane positioning ATPase MipZ [Rickettsiales bacterium]|jgi:chromosome partitioning protein|nr:division plane positioning ATPase MipZ [Rickettsiales bacterium]
MENNNTHIIVIGNEKGGAGKTTTSMHLIASLLHLGFKVTSVDADCRQKSLSRYLENRAQHIKKHAVDLKIPKHFTLEESTDREVEQRRIQDHQQLKKLVEAELSSEDIPDFLIIDTPGSNTYLSNYAHSIADTIITPINDSFLDLDVIAQIEADTFKIIRPSFYAQAIWEQKMEKAKRSRGEINWVVLRNRLSALDAKNKRKMSNVLDKLSARLGFKVASGFNERVIYRELFLHGLTLLDVKKGVMEVSLSLSHIAAKQELNNLLHQLNIKNINEALLALEELG